jgi:hypothetical protein
MMPCRAGDLSDEDPVRVRPHAILIHLDRIEHGYGKSKLASSMVGSVRLLGMLAVISLGVLPLTLNWFDVAGAFPLIASADRVQKIIMSA